MAIVLAGQLCQMLADDLANTVERFLTLRHDIAKPLKIMIHVVSHFQSAIPSTPVTPISKGANHVIQNFSTPRLHVYRR